MSAQLMEYCNSIVYVSSADRCLLNSCLSETMSHVLQKFSQTQHLLGIFIIIKIAFLSNFSNFERLLNVLLSLSKEHVYRRK